VKKVKRFARELSVIAGLFAVSANCALLQATQDTASANEPPPANGQYTVKRIIDGDTIRVVNPYGGEDIRVRFACIDTPEIKGSEREQGVKAKDELTQILQEAGMRVQLIFNAQDRYKRWVADVRLFNGTLVQEMLVRKRLAIFKPQYRSHCPNTFAVLQRAAGQVQR
jgi:micrococcal nuclease